MGLEIIFWITLALILYIYVGYLLLNIIIGYLLKDKPLPANNNMPTLTMVISAYNEEEIIREKLDNCLGLDYPAEKLSIVVISDASDDRTDEIVHNYPDKRIRLEHIEGRKGKTYGITQVVPQIDTEIIVFSDANAIYKKDALTHLVKHFLSPIVGYVVGNAQYYKEGQSDAGEQEKAYWDMEIKLKVYESRLGSVVGGDGAIYAIRKKLFLPLAEDDINDFVNPLQIVLQGYRGVFEPRAVCYEHTAESYEKEIGRKRRIVNRSWRGLMKNKAVLNPFKTGFHAFQVFSHKYLRWIGGVFLFLLFVQNTLLLDQGVVYPIFFIAQCLFYVLAIIGTIQVKLNQKLFFPISAIYYFVQVNIASLMGIIDNYNGKKYTTWQTIRENL